MVKDLLQKDIFLAIMLFGLMSMQLSTYAEEIPSVSFNVTAFTINGENPLSESITNNILSTFLGDHTGIEGLLEAAAELESAITAAGHSFNRVLLPPQTLEAGIVELKVIQIKLANVEVDGNKHFSDENIIRSLPKLITGSTPDTKLLARQLIVANEHPSKNITLRMKPGEAEDSVNAVLKVQDQRPWQVFSILNNIGTSKSGRLRFSAGGQHNNLLGFDDSFTASYTTSPGNTSDVKQWGLNYRLPVYKYSGSFDFFYSKSDVDSGTVQGVFDVSGAGKFLGGSYTQHLLNRKNYRHRIRVGVEDKFFHNNVSFNNNQLGVDVRSRPLTLSYFGELQMEKAQFNFNLNYVRNLNGGNKNTSGVYSASRTGAEQDWDVVRYNATYNCVLNKQWLMKLALKGQWSNERLISGEQFGIGGSNSVRGFEERAVSGDRGNQATLQFSRPVFKKKAQLRLFSDLGHIKVISPTSGQIGSQTLMSVGTGVTWSISDNFNLSVDYAHEMNEGRSTDIGGTKTHVSLFFKY